MLAPSLRRALHLCGSVGAMLFVFAATAFAHSDMLTPYDLARIQTVGNVTVSPDGDFVAYTVSVPRDPFEANATPYSELYLYDVSAGASRGLRTGAVSHSGLQWTPDGRLSFLTKASDGDTRPALYVKDSATGSMERVLSFGASIGAYTWAPDGQQVAFVA